MECRYFIPPLDSVYPAYAKQKGFKPESVSMRDGLMGYWIGDPGSEDVMIWFHGLVPLFQPASFLALLLRFPPFFFHQN